MKTNWPTVLVVDDVYHNYFLIQEILASFQIHVICAQSGFESLELCKKNEQISLVLMDIKMKGMNGFEASSNIKSFRTKLPIIAVTSYAREFRQDLLMSQVFEGFLEKPVKLPALMVELRKFIPVTSINVTDAVLKPSAIRSFLRSIL